MSRARRLWWLDMAGYDAEAWRWLVEGIDGQMSRADQIAYLRGHLDPRSYPAPSGRAAVRAGVFDPS